MAHSGPPPEPESTTGPRTGPATGTGTGPLRPHPEVRRDAPPTQPGWTWFIAIWVFVILVTAGMWWGMKAISYVPDDHFVPTRPSTVEFD